MMSTLELLDVPRIAADLMASAETTGDSKATRIVVDAKDMSVAIVALRRGGRIAHRDAPRSTVIVPIFGRVRYATGNGVVDLLPGRPLWSGRGRRHEIIADEDAALMFVEAA
jgi:quercetin dioxygenase-like cupin family protein